MPAYMKDCTNWRWNSRNATSSGATALGSIARASAALDVSPPAISAAIKGFERQYGYRLFVRNPARGLAVTPSGRSFVTQARRLLEAERGFDNRAQGIGQQLIGELHVGCYFITAPFLLGRIARRLASRHPDLTVTLHEGDLIRVVRDLKAGHTDVAVTNDIYLDGGVEFERAESRRSGPRGASHWSTGTPGDALLARWSLPVGRHMFWFGLPTIAETCVQQILTKSRFPRIMRVGVDVADARAGPGPE